MEMEKSYYVVKRKPAYFELTRGRGEGERSGVSDDSGLEPLIVAITQGGFGQDVIDDERQVKERFLEHLFATGGLDLPRSEEVFDLYFKLEKGEVIDLDEEI